MTPWFLIGMIAKVGSESLGPSAFSPAVLSMGIRSGAMQRELAADCQPCEPCSWTRTSILNDALSCLLAMQSFTTYQIFVA